MTKTKTTSKTSSKPVFDVTKHVLVPKHEKLSEKQREALFKKYKIKPQDLPKIFITDPAIRGLDVKPGDVIKITRQSPTAGVSTYYRIVVSKL